MSEISNIERKPKSREEEKTSENPFDRKTYILNYLKNNPDFFIQCSEALLDIDTIDGKVSSSLAFKQVKALRERNLKLRGKINELIEIATINETLLHKTFSMTLNLFEADSFDSFCTRLHSHLKEEFNTEAVSLMVFNDKLKTTHYTHVNHTQIDKAKQHIKHLLLYNQVFCGLLRETEAQFLFPNTTQPNTRQAVRSAAIIPILPALTQEQPEASNQTPTALLSIGSKDPLHFKAKQGQTFLSQLQQACNLCFAKFLEKQSHAKTYLL